METTILLAKVLGAFLVISGLVIMVRRRYFITAIGAFVKERLMRLVLSAIELIAGLFLIFTHNDFSSLPAGIISVFGWVAVVESVFYFSASDRLLQKFLDYFKSPTFYVFGGLFSMAVGAYLLAYGFGMM